MAPAFQPSNQTLAQVGTVAYSIAIVAWSLVLLEHGSRGKSEEAGA